MPVQAAAFPSPLRKSPLRPILVSLDTQPLSAFRTSLTEVLLASYPLPSFLP